MMAEEPRHVTGGEGDMVTDQPMSEPLTGRWWVAFQETWSTRFEETSFAIESATQMAEEAYGTR